MQVKASIKLTRLDFVGYIPFSLQLPENATLLDMLIKIKEDMDQSLSFRSMCRAGVCGTCAIKVNGKPVLACSTKVSIFGEELTIEPIDQFSVIKDLVVDHEGIYSKLRLWKVWMTSFEENIRFHQETLRKVEKSHECILCGVCDSVCPVFTISQDFGGPLLLTRYQKLVFDPRNAERDEKLQTLKSINPQLCTHCMNCSFACPKKLMPEALIKEEENLLYQKGILQKPEGGFEFLSF
uniref:Fumarate reductase iron-sulfur subunit n=1 Tax=uncultured Aquificia bacterium TaxID=453415 RepID=H5SBX3_9BACT|nr:fumarate reductase iron-sulfur subunit [uncultured Aquificae bacterium]